MTKIETFIIHAHGCQPTTYGVSTISFTVPDNCYIFALCSHTGMVVNEETSNMINREASDDIFNNLTTENTILKNQIYNALTKFLSLCANIKQRTNGIDTPADICYYLPGTTMSNIEFSYTNTSATYSGVSDGYKFAQGTYRLPLQIPSDSRCSNSIYECMKGSHTVKTFSLKHTVNELLTTHSSDSIFIIFIFSCRVISQNTYHRRVVRTDDSNRQCPFTEKSLHRIAVTVFRHATGYSGGTNNNTNLMICYTAKKRKYVIHQSKRWYLDEHRGKYRYTNSLKTHIRIIGENMLKRSILNATSVIKS